MTAITKKVPDINELYDDRALVSKQSELIQLLNYPPKKEWVKHHPTITVKDENNQFVPLKYLSIQTVEYILTSIFVKWRVEIKETKLIANSVTVVVRLYVQDPISLEWDFQDGVGASPIQTDKGAGAIDFNAMKNGAIQMAAPAAESYAIKDAAEKFGKIFGKDLNRRDNYDIISQMEGKLDLATINQIQYIHTLLRSSTLEEAQKLEIEAQLEGIVTAEKAGKIIDQLKANQLDPITETSRYNQSDIKERVGEIIKE